MMNIGIVCIKLGIPFFGSIFYFCRYLLPHIIDWSTITVTAQLIQI